MLDSLAEICPVRAVRGNMDGGAWGRTLPGSEAVELAGRLIYMLHDLGQLDLDPEAAGISAVIFGHSHVPAVQRRDGVLYVNPGSAGPQRPGKPISVGLLELGDELEAKIIEII